VPSRSRPVPTISTSTSDATAPVDEAIPSSPSASQCAMRARVQLCREVRYQSL
jgi:hypothetical protein